MLRKQLINKFGKDYLSILSTSMRIDKQMLSDQLTGKTEMEGYIKCQLHNKMGIYLYQLEKLLGYEK
jgi:hypothetical protein